MLPFDDSQVHILLLDIEGTTTPVDFVTKTLFPYASRKLESFLREFAGNPEIYSLMEELHGQCEREHRNGLDLAQSRTHLPRRSRFCPRLLLAIRIQARALSEHSKRRSVVRVG